MSYRPSGGKGAYNISNVHLRDRPARIPWLWSCGSLFLGFILGMIGLFLGALFYFGTPVSNNLIPGPPYAGVADLSATLSENYLNSTIEKIVKSSTINLEGLATVKESLIRIRPNQLIDLSLKLGNSMIDFDVTATEKIGLVNGKIVLQPVGQPKVGQGNLPFGGDKVVELANTTLIQPEINKALADVIINKRSFRVVDVTTSQGLITLKFNVQ